jgi:hypothetical protein
MIKEVLIVLLLVLTGIFIFLLYTAYSDFYAGPSIFKVNQTQLQEQPSYPTSSQLQFYPNMRFSTDRISYRVGVECPNEKRKDVQDAVNIIEDRVKPLSLYEISSDADIEIRCGEEFKKEGFLVAGEGGPRPGRNTTLFIVIPKGDVLLLYSGPCSSNVALHEILHVLGFNHSANKNSIMYPLTSCSQVVTNDIADELNRLYSIESLPDLYFEKAAATKRGRYVNLNFTIKNQGLSYANNILVSVYADDEKIKEFNLGSIGIGAGEIISAENLRAFSNTKSLKLISSDGKEISYNNNQVSLFLT